MNRYKELNELPLALTTVEIAKVLGISRNKAYQLTSSEGFPALRIGKRIVIPRDRFIEWFNEPKVVNV